MKITDRSDLWWKTAVVYCLDVETYMDWNDDGSGDFEGLAHRLDHLAELGVTCIWLMPFQPTPDRDDGYDITDFTGVGWNGISQRQVTPSSARWSSRCPRPSKSPEPSSFQSMYVSTSRQ